MKNTTADVLTAAITFVVCLASLLVLGFIVLGNDKGSATEVALLNGTSIPASDGQCDALYEAMWKVSDEPNHSILINMAKSLDCPLDDK